LFTKVIYRKGKSWSPLTWQVLEGADSIPITICEAVESVDSGYIYLQEWIAFHGDELLDDLRCLQVKVTHWLCRAFVKMYPEIQNTSRPQVGEPTYYRKRNPEDSRLDTVDTITV